MEGNQYSALDAISIAKLVRTGEVPPAEVLEVALQTIARVNPALNAIIDLYPDLAGEQVDEGLPRGPLQGVPIVLKDLASPCKGTRTTYGSRLFAGVQPWEHDCVMVSRLKRAGAVVVGRTNCGEFGISLSTQPVAYGPTRNPNGLQREAGGSSGGSAAAVASGMLPLALGTDGCGSLRVPAAYCGAFSLKSSRGVISFAPDLGESWAGMTVHGSITRTVRDSALFLDVVSGAEQGDPYSAAPATSPYLEQVQRRPRRLQIGVIEDKPDGSAIDPEYREAVGDMAKLCLSLGHGARSFSLALDIGTLSHHLATIWGAQLWTLIEPQYEKGGAVDGKDMEEESWQLAESARSLRATDHLAAIRYLHRCGRELAADMSGVDVLLGPVAAEPPDFIGPTEPRYSGAVERIAHLFARNPFTVLANVAGVPAMSVPWGRSASNLPVGVQFVGKQGDDGLLLALAAQIEAFHPWLLQPAMSVD